MASRQHQGKSGAVFPRYFRTHRASEKQATSRAVTLEKMYTTCTLSSLQLGAASSSEFGTGQKKGARKIIKSFLSRLTEAALQPKYSVTSWRKSWSWSLFFFFEKVGFLERCDINLVKWGG